MSGRGDVFHWLLALLLLFAMVAFVGYARGAAHHHGQQVGAAGTAVVVTAAAPGYAHGHG
jgi:hypothetical protein